MTRCSLINKSINQYFLKKWKKREEESSMLLICLDNVLLLGSLSPDKGKELDSLISYVEATLSLPINFYQFPRFVNGRWEPFN